MSRHPTPWRNVSVLSSHLCLGLPCGPLPLRYTTKSRYAPITFPIRATWPANFILDWVTWIIFGEYKSQTSKLCSLRHCYGTSSHLGPNISSPNRNHIKSDSLRNKDDFYSSRFISGMPTIRLSKRSIRRITKADSSHEILREYLNTFEDIRVERFPSETLNTSIRLVLSESVLAVTRFTIPPVGHYPNISN
jgi:hypothetical protein